MFDRPGPFAHGPRARRGEIRAGILALLKERALNGYQIMQELESRSHGVWRPSPGSVYPTLQLLEDEGLVSAQESGDGKTFKLTGKGETWLTKHPRLAEAPWTTLADSASGGYVALLDLVRAVTMTTRQIIQLGTTEQKEAAVDLLRATRKSLLRILAEDDEVPGRKGE
jgi:DNA-binding PadR family transcriptional regulator